MSQSIGYPDPDCGDRRLAGRARRAARDRIADLRQGGVTRVSGEEVDFDLSYALNFHKGLPHDVTGQVHAASYNAMVRMLTGQEYGAAETLPVGRNRNARNGVATNPPRYTVTAKDDPATDTFLGYRQLTSPFTGHVYDTEGADAAAFAIAPAPLVASEELAAELAELYVMALLRDASFAEVSAGTGPASLGTLVAALGGMSWFNGTFQTTDAAEQRRFDAREPVANGDDLFRGSTPGAKHGPWLSQFLLMGNDNGRFAIEPPAAGDPGQTDPDPSFVGTATTITRKAGFVLYGTQVIDQRVIVAKEGTDYLTTWAAWLDCQNGVDFNDFDVFRHRRRFMTTPRDLATYVHYDALYQAYLNACLLMAADGKAFGKDRGLPETTSRTRAAFASFGGPHILTLVTEVATRALKAVWRQKWMHHRRARPEVVAALLTLEASDPKRIESEDLRASLAALRALIPADILAAVDAHNTAQNALPSPALEPKPPADLPADFPQIAAGKNYLLPMAFPEGSPVHPAYGAGHATVAGACVTVLKAFFEMREPSGAPRAWPYADVFQAERDLATGTSALKVVAPLPKPLTIEGELDKLAANIAIGRNMAGVHYSTDYYESLRLGERIAVSILQEHLSMYGEPVSMSFTSFDGEQVRIASNGDAATVRVVNGTGQIDPSEWFDRYAA